MLADILSWGGGFDSRTKSLEFPAGAGLEEVWPSMARWVATEQTGLVPPERSKYKKSEDGREGGRREKLRWGLSWFGGRAKYQSYCGGTAWYMRWTLILLFFRFII